MFEALVIANKPMPLPLAGSNQVLGGTPARLSYLLSRLFHSARMEHPLREPDPPDRSPAWADGGVPQPGWRLGRPLRLRLPRRRWLGYRRHGRRAGLVLDLHALPNVMRQRFRGTGALMDGAAVCSRSWR